MPRGSPEKTFMIETQRNDTEQKIKMCSFYSKLSVLAIEIAIGAGTAVSVPIRVLRMKPIITEQITLDQTSAFSMKYRRKMYSRMKRQEGFNECMDTSIPNMQFITKGQIL